MRLFTIPTNRPCLSYAKSYIEEIEFAEKKYNEQILFLVMGSGNKEIDENNAKDFQEWNKNNSSQIEYIGIDAQNKWIKSIIENTDIEDKEYMLQIFNPPKNKICYGDVLNKSFLAAVSLDAKSMHRRDSDTCLINNEKRYPLDIEIQYLSNKYNQFEELKLDSNEKIYFVGGNYKGEASGDFLKLYNVNPELLYRHVGMNYPNKTKEEVKELAIKRFVEASSESDNEEIKTVMDRMIELGNCAYYEVYKYLPVSPALEIMATDYFIHDILFALDLPNVYHKYRVQHNHTSERSSIEWFVSYQLRSARYKVFSGIMTAGFNIYKKSKTDIYHASIEFAGALENVLTSNEYIEVGRYKLKTLKEIYRDSGLADFGLVADAIDGNEDDIIKDVAEEVKKHIFLLRNWKKLVDSAKNNKITNYIK